MNMIKFAGALWRGGEETGISRDTKGRKKQIGKCIAFPIPFRKVFNLWIDTLNAFYVNENDASQKFFVAGTGTIWTMKRTL